MAGGGGGVRVAVTTTGRTRGNRTPLRDCGTALNWADITAISPSSDDRSVPPGWGRTPPPLPLPPPERSRKPRWRYKRGQGQTPTKQIIFSWLFVQTPSVVNRDGSFEKTTVAIGEMVWSV